MAQSSPFIKQVSTFTDYGVEAKDIDRQRKMAELLQQQSAAPIEERPGVPISWTQGLAKMLQAYYGKQGLDKASQKEKDLSQRYTTDRGEALASALKAGEGTAATPEKWTGEAGDELYQPEVAARPGDRMATYRSLASSKFPELQTMGMAELLKTPESLFGRIQPNDYTPESVAKFSASKNFSDLVPVRKMEAVQMAGPNGAPATGFVNPYAPPQNPIPQAIKNEMVPLGNTVQPVNPYAQTSPLNIGVSPNTVATQAGEDRRFAGVSGSARLASDTTRRGQDIGANPEIQGNLAAARGAGTALGQSSATAQINLPKTIADVAQMSSIVKQMIGDANVDKDGKIVIPKGGANPHKGFSVSVGASAQPGFQYISGTDKADFYALKDQITSDAFLQAYTNSLKGGGAITEVEGTKGTQALLRARTSQSEPEFVKAMREFEAANQRIVDAEKGKAGAMRRRASDSKTIDFSALPP